MTHTGPNLTRAMRREWNRKLVERRARRAIAAIRPSAPQPYNSNSACTHPGAGL